MNTRNLTTALAALLIAFSVRGQDCSGNTVTDIDGNVYPVVTIGTQCWMAENLRTSRYRDGSNIPNVTSNMGWTDGMFGVGAWCNYDNDPNNDAVYGKLYNWLAAGNDNLCPLGWHVPTDEEWMTLESSLGMPANELEVFDPNRGVAQNVGGKLKAITLWESPNTGATNTSGFTALPTGYRDYFMGTYLLLDTYSYLWTASLNDNGYPWSRSLGNTSPGVGRDYQNRLVGACVRCLRDGNVGVIEAQPVRFTIAPNPTRGTIVIDHAANTLPQTVTLMDATGRTLWVQNIAVTNRMTIDLSSYENGLYLLQLDFADGTKALERVVKE
ncbi:MAG: T9SS type A sorting domain-containing protein [Flavobacteriales bacterium]|jgi:uncharacterized protein (TIGR02145 family)|nr:T9SS type A sorting domain-containing protein [Flavobacteriales bacterium]